MQHPAASAENTVGRTAGIVSSGSQRSVQTSTVLDIGCPGAIPAPLQDYQKTRDIPDSMTNYQYYMTITQLPGLLA